MEINKVAGKLLQIVKKYRYVMLIVLIGMALMSIPSKSTAKVQKPVTNVSQEDTDDISVELTRILGRIYGVGRVEVMLTKACGPEAIYQTDADYDEDNSGRSGREDTVIITDSSRNETALIRKTVSAQYQGAIIVCQGADSPQVRLALVEAVSKVTGLGSDRIAIVKMN